MDETPELGHMIAYCARLGMVYNEKRLRRAGYDITPVQSHVLVHLAHLGEKQAANQRELERALHLKPSTVNGIVSRLEEKGYIARRASPADARCRLVSLTESGQKKVDAFHAVLHGTARRFAACLTEAEEEVLRELLSRIIENLENEVNSV